MAPRKPNQFLGVQQRDDHLLAMSRGIASAILEQRGRKADQEAIPNHMSLLHLYSSFLISYKYINHHDPQGGSHGYIENSTS